MLRWLRDVVIGAIRKTFCNISELIGSADHNYWENVLRIRLPNLQCDDNGFRVHKINYNRIVCGGGDTLSHITCLHTAVPVISGI